MSMKIIAHRGGTDQYPELTLDAAAFSLGSGADYVEMDIRFTKDMVPVISHDDNASVLFGSTKEIADLTLDEFLSLRYKQNPHYSAITLSQVFHSGVFPILFHIKVGGERLQKILTCISAYMYEDKVIMGVTTPDDVKAVKDYNPQIKVLGFSPKKDLLPIQADQGADIIRLWEAWTTQEDIDHYHTLGKAVWIMAGNQTSEGVGYTRDDNITLWEKWGADGILVNEVLKTKAILSKIKV